MGICISSASSQIRHETNKVGSVLEEDYCKKSYCVCGIQKLESICSKQGRKGVNQDAAFSYQVINCIRLIKNESFRITYE